jgi:hypothetical protein
MGTLARLSVIASAALLGACATYKPHSVWGGLGYSESKRAPGVYQVWFVDEHTTEDRGADLAELRAAELCLGEGKPFMRTSDFQRGAPSVRTTHNIKTIRTYRTGEVTSNPQLPTASTQMIRTQGQELIMTRSGLLVTCLAEKSDDEAQEAAIVAASIRERYAIATRSTPQTPNR